MDPEIKQLLLQVQISGFCILPNMIPLNDCEAIRDSVARTVQLQRENYRDAPTHVGFTPSFRAADVIAATRQHEGEKGDYHRHDCIAQHPSTPFRGRPP